MLRYYLYSRLSVLIYTYHPTNHQLRNIYIYIYIWNLIWLLKVICMHCTVQSSYSNKNYKTERNTIKRKRHIFSCRKKRFFYLCFIRLCSSNTCISISICTSPVTEIIAWHPTTEVQIKWSWPKYFLYRKWDSHLIFVQRIFKNLYVFVWLDSQ